MQSNQKGVNEGHQRSPWSLSGRCKDRVRVCSMRGDMKRANPRKTMPRQTGWRSAGRRTIVNATDVKRGIGKSLAVGNGGESARGESESAS